MPEPPGRAETSTRDHDEIMRWARDHGAVPGAAPAMSTPDEMGTLTFAFPDREDGESERISWDRWLREFDRRGLDFVYWDCAGERVAGGFALRRTTSERSRPEYTGTAQMGLAGPEDEDPA